MNNLKMFKRIYEYFENVWKKLWIFREHLREIKMLVIFERRYILKNIAQMFKLFAFHFYIILINNARCRHFWKIWKIFQLFKIYVWNLHRFISHKNFLPYRRLYTIKHCVNILSKCKQQTFNVNIMFLFFINYLSVWRFLNAT